VVVSTPRLNAIASLLISGLFIVLWYWLLLNKPPSVHAVGAAIRELPDRGLWLCLFALVPLLGIPSFYGAANTAIRGRVYTFDGTSRTITLNGVLVAQFGEVETVQVRTVSRTRGPNEYLLSLLLQGDRKVSLGQSNDHDSLLTAADNIADELEVKVRSV
jgi:hypothetical protein